MPNSTIALANTALLSIATTALAGASPAVQIVDGEIGEFVAAEQFVLVNTTFTEDPGALVGANPAVYYEHYDMHCFLRTFSGGTTADLPTLRARVLQMYGLVRNALAADQTLGGVVQQGYSSGGTVEVGVAGNGLAAVIEFTVHVNNLATT